MNNFTIDLVLRSDEGYAVFYVSLSLYLETMSKVDRLSMTVNDSTRASRGSYDMSHIPVAEKIFER